MLLGLKVITAPTEEAVKIEDVKAHLRIDISDDDGFLKILMQSARESVEQWIRRSLITQTLEALFDLSDVGMGGMLSKPMGQDYRLIELPMPPLQSITSVESKTDRESDFVALANTAYEVDTSSEPGTVWSVDAWSAQFLRVRYVAGYGDDERAVPGPLKLAIMQLVAHYYENREPIAQGNITPVTLPLHVQQLLGQYKIWRL